MKFLLILFSTGVLAAETLVRGQQKPAVNPILNALTSHGCYKSKASLKDPGNYNGQGVTSGMCHEEVCNKLNATVLGLRGTTCYCGFEYPPKEDLVEDKFCNYACNGYPFEACMFGIPLKRKVGTLRTQANVSWIGGSVDGVYYSIFNTGVKVDVDSAEPVASTSSKGTSSPTSKFFDPHSRTWPQSNRWY